MHTKILVLFALFSVCLSRDITIGSNSEGRKIFDETREASPAIWRQIENVTVIAPSDELISGVVVTDMRPEKDGDAKIVDGGKGQKSVTIELKSPTVLRGYEFHIEIFSVPETMFTDAEENLSSGVELNVTPQNEQTTVPSETSSGKDVPAVVADETSSEQVRPARETLPEATTSSEIITTPAFETSSIVDNTNNPTELAKSATTTEVPETADLNTDNVRPAREVNVDATNLAVTDINSVVTESNIKEITTESESTTMPADEVITSESITFDNSKNIPDYPSLNILDYIKSKESTRLMRHTEGNSNSPQNEPGKLGVTNLEESVSTTPKDDDTVDLVPPEVDAQYNKDFTGNLETTEPSVDTSTVYVNKPRAGRGLNVDNEEESTPVPSTTEVVTTFSSEDNTTDIASIDYEQPRNTRDARKDPEEDFPNGENMPTVPQDTGVLNNGVTTCSTKLGENTGNVIVINRDQLTMTTEDNKLAFPIVLIITSDNKFPEIKVIAEGTPSDLENKVMFYATQPMEDQNESEVKTEESEDVNMSSGDYQPKPVTF